MLRVRLVDVKGVTLEVDDEESRKREESEIGNNTVRLRYAGVSQTSRWGLDWYQDI